MDWKRSAECRLCLCPVADTGVRMDQLDSEKLSMWWKQKLKSKLQPDENLENAWICQFCLWDARIEHEYSEKKKNNDACDWWSGFDTNVAFYKYYYTDAVVKSCFISAEVQGDASRRAAEHHVCARCKLTFRSLLALKVHSGQAHMKRVECSYCDIKTYRLRTHLKKMHPSLNVCKYRMCMQVFKSNTAKWKHELNEHEEKGEFRCELCVDKEFSLGRNSLISHLKSCHQNHKIHRCNYASWCNRMLISEAEVMMHMMINHKSSEEEIECKVCKQKVIRPHLNAHMRRFHDSSTTNAPFADALCCYCQNKFPSRKAVFKHVREDHCDIETFKCFECEICYKTNDEKKEHYQKVHRGHFPCIYCVNFACTNRMNLRRHIRTKHKSVVIQCRYSNKCGLYFKTQEELQKHTSSHETDKIDKLQCIYCTKFLPSKHFHRHIRTHHKAVAIKCGLSKCQSFFLSKEDLEEHVKQVHQVGTSLNKVKCPCCPKKFADFDCMEKHATIIHSKKIVKCTFRLCRFVCADDQLEIHIKKQHAEHVNATKLVCSSCEFFCYTKKGMYHHEQRLHGTENLKCHHCPKKNFKSKFAMEAHVVGIHIMKQCRHCSSSSTFGANGLKNHQRRRSCKFCKVAFPCANLYSKHECKCKRKRFARK